MEVKYERREGGVPVFSFSYAALNISKTRIEGTVKVSFITKKNEPVKDLQEHFGIGPSRNRKYDGTAAASQILIDQSLLPVLEKIQVTIVVND
jgi:hypothetical protein